MAHHNRVELLGYLGADPKVINAEGGKTFLALSVATTDSYPVKDMETLMGETKWIERETVWHDVVIFRPATAHYGA